MHELHENRCNKLKKEIYAVIPQSGKFTFAALGNYSCVLFITAILCKYVTEFAKRGLIHAIINIEKSRFEILNTVYLENAWCLVYEILHQSIVIQGNSVGVLFDGLLAELPTILDSFFHQYHK